jgi:hypothetical protein
MLRWAGIGVAMGNAEPEVKQAVRYVTASNDKDGVALAIDRFCPAAPSPKQSLGPPAGNRAGVPSRKRP